MKQFETGEKVDVICHGGAHRQNVVWATGERVVYVCSERQVQALRAGKAAPPPIGFLIGDVQPTDEEQTA